MDDIVAGPFSKAQEAIDPWEQEAPPPILAHKKTQAKKPAFCLLSDLIDSVELLIEVSRNTFVDSSKCLQDFKIGIFTDEVG